MTEDNPQTPSGFAGAERQHLGTMLDSGSFTKLYTAAQQSGICPNADTIISVRDAEFPAKRYQKVVRYDQQHV